MSRPCACTGCVLTPEQHAAWDAALAEAHQAHLQAFTRFAAAEKALKSAAYALREAQDQLTAVTRNLHRSAFGGRS